MLELFEICQGTVIVIGDQVCAADKLVDLRNIITPGIFPPELFQRIQGVIGDLFPDYDKSAEFTFGATGEALMDAYAFDPFAIVRAGYTRFEHGTGLGLALVRKIVDDHEGHIQVEGEPGVGAAFTIYLPAAVRYE